MPAGTYKSDMYNADPWPPLDEIVGFLPDRDRKVGGEGKATVGPRGQVAIAPRGRSVIKPRGQVVIK